MMRSQAKRAAFQLLGSSFNLKRRLRALRQKGTLTVLCFHRVAPHDGSSYAPLSPALFDEALGFCAREFDLLTFAELGTYRRGGRPAAIISFDDGYRDFVDYAMPILDCHGVRCNLNVIVQSIETGRPPVNVQLQDFIGKAPAEELSLLAIPGFPPIIGTENRTTLGASVSNYVKSRPMHEQKAMVAAVLPQIEFLPHFQPTPMMRRDDVRLAAAKHEIGAHSLEHATLAFESDDYVAADARECGEYLADITGRRPFVYALPNGEARAGQIELIAGQGFRHVLLTGENHSAPSAHIHPRFLMYGDSAAELRFRATGFVRKSKRMAELQ